MEYVINNVQERGQWGDGMQDYAIALDGQQGWIKLTQKLATPPPVVGSTISGRVETKTNRNGKSYLKFTKERANDFGGGNRTQPSSNNQEAYIVQMLEELTGRRQVEDVVHPMPKESEDIKLEDPFQGLGI